MKELIFEEILFTKQNEPHNVKKIQRLQQMLDYPSYSIKDFVDTGEVYSREDFEHIYSECQLDDACKFVMKYAGGYYIEMLGDGRYLFTHPSGKKSKPTKDLEKLEEKIFKNIISNES